MLTDVKLFFPEGAADGLMKALNDVLEDGRFKLPSAVASTARVSAVKLLEWASKDENRAMLVSFAEETIAHLDTAFDSRMKRPHRQREKMWANYHKIRTSSSFLSRWSSFTTLAVGRPATLILTQHLTMLMFREMIRQRFPLEKGPSTTEDLPPLSGEEENALRYAAGYVCRNLRKKLERSTHPLKEELILGIMDLLDDDDDDEEGSCETWMNSIDRGGLWHVSDTTFMVFQSMEEVVREHLRKSNMQSLSLSGGKHILIGKITSGEDVRFNWCIAAADFGEAEEKILLEMIVELWVTIRGFSFVSGWIEQYKQANKKTLQKSKALRSGLFSSSSSADSST